MKWGGVWQKVTDDDGGGLAKVTDDYEVGRGSGKILDDVICERSL